MTVTRRPAAHPIALALFLAALLVPLWVAAPRSTAQPGPQDGKLEEAIARFEKLKDATPPEDLETMGKSKDPRALDSLLNNLQHLNSLGSRQRAVQALCGFAGAAELEHKAFERVHGIIGDETSPALQRAALRSLARAGGVAMDYVGMIVDAPLDDELRELAMELHTKSPREKDYGWYRELWKPKPAPEEDKRRSKKDKDDAPPPAKQAHKLQAIRALAFRALAPKLTDEELVEASKDDNGSIRLVVLDEMQRRKLPGIVEVAERLFSDRRNASTVRARAARVMAADKGDDVLELLIDEGAHREAPTALWRALGPVVAEYASEDFAGKLIKRLGRAKDNEKWMLLASLAKYQDEKFAGQLRKLLSDKEPETRLLAAQILGDRGDTGARDDVERQLSRSKDPAESRVLFETLVELQRPLAKDDAAWHTRLEELAKGEDVGVAGLALRELVHLRGEAAMGALETALVSPEWSLRLIAAEELEKLRVPRSVALIVGQIPAETGRLRIEMGRLLWRLTGQGFGVNADNWQRWYADEGSDFEPITVEDLEALALEEELRRLELSTEAQFFGVRLESERITFVIDVSGSMEWDTRGRYAEQTGEKRIVIAKRELIRALKGLTPETLFNIVVFSERARPWQKELVRATPDQVEAAVAHVGKFLPGGATNIYEAIEVAFQDPALDTLFVLSDGQPAGGKVDDPVLIRDHVRRWNAGRNVRIHTIAIAESLPILRWLSEDTGGTHVFIP